jgi:RNA polymerase sigma-70 factor (ECF subfamily)
VGERPPRPSKLPAVGGYSAEGRPATPCGRLEDATDGTLMGRVRHGDERAFALLVERYEGSLVNYLCRLTGCRDRAEDFAQETFVRLFQHAARYQEQGQFAAYLYRIATNLVRSEERRRRRWRLIDLVLQKAPEVPQTLPNREVFRNEVQAVVGEAINQLPLHFRAPLVLREIEERSYEEIATALGCRVGTVKSRINRAKAQLRERLRHYWEGELAGDREA